MSSRLHGIGCVDERLQVDLWKRTLDGAKSDTAYEGDVHAIGGAKRW